MSRIGKKAISLPEGVEVSFSAPVVKVKGKQGELSQELAPGFEVEVEAAEVSVKRPSDSKDHRARHGLYRALISNMVIGVSEGFERRLAISGVGYTAKAEGPSKLNLSIGFCHPVIMESPAGVTVETPSPTEVVVKGTSKQAVGQFAAEVRKVRPPEPYKGKGIRYADEVVRRKQGKAVGGK